MGIRSISEIKGLKYLTDLEILFLHNNQISKIEGLKNLTRLKILVLVNNKISKIEELENLTNLEKLYLTDNQIQKIQGLENLTRLETLFLGGNQVKEIRGLEHLTTLEELDLGSNKIEEIKGLEQLINLKSLDLSYNPIKKIEGLPAFKNLQYFEIDKDNLSKEEQELVKKIREQAWKKRQEEIERIKQRKKKLKKRKKKRLLKIKNPKRLGVKTSQQINNLREKAIARITRNPYKKSHWKHTNRYLDYLIKDKLLDSTLFKFDPRHFRDSLYHAYYVLRSYYWGSFYNSFFESSMWSFSGIYLPTKEIAIYLRLLNLLIHCIEERSCNPYYTAERFRAPPEILRTIPKFSGLAPFEKVREYIDFISKDVGKTINWFFDDLLGEDADKRTEMNPHMLVPIPLCFYSETSHLRDKLIELIGEDPAEHEEFHDPLGSLWYRPAFVNFLDSPDFCGKLLPYLMEYMTSLVARFTKSVDLEEVTQLATLFSALFKILALDEVKVHKRITISYDILRSQIKEWGLQSILLEKLIRKISPNNTQFANFSIKRLLYHSAELYRTPLILDESRNRIYTSIMLLYDSFLTIFAGKLQKVNYEIRGQMAENYVAYYITRFFKDKMMIEYLDRHNKLAKAIIDGFQRNIESSESFTTGNPQYIKNEFKRMIPDLFPDLFDDSQRLNEPMSKELQTISISMRKWQRHLIRYFKDMKPQIDVLKNNAHQYLKTKPFKLIFYSTNPQKLKESNYAEMKLTAHAFKLGTYEIPINDNELKGFRGAKEFDVCCIIGNTLLVVEIKDHLFREMYNVPHIVYLKQLKLTKYMKNLETWFLVPSVKQKIEDATKCTYSDVKATTITQMPFFQSTGELCDLKAFSNLLLRLVYESQYGKNSSDQKLFLLLPSFPDYPEEWRKEEGSR